MQAFPVLMKIGDVAQSEGGMTLRDYFAAKALQGMFADHTLNAGFSQIAESAYTMADEMLKAGGYV